jgi:thiosulfate reductase cytochrome b subunit
VAPAVRAGSLPVRQDDVAPPQEDAAVVESGGASTVVVGVAAGVVLRRGLPRVAGGEPWPPAGTVAAVVAAGTGVDVEPVGVVTDVESQRPVPSADGGAERVVSAALEGPVVSAGSRVPLTVPRTVWPGKAALHRPVPAPVPVRVGPFTRVQWVGVVVVGGGGLLVAVGMAVAFVRALLSMSFMQEFLAAFPGEYHLPVGAPVGIPAWIGWQHFFNVFLMVLIIRSGVQIRREKRPVVFWAPRGNPKGKTSLTIWFHQSLDILWLVNGVVFVVLLLVTGQWMRIVPTSWEVFPNALQYVSLDWPTENGWVNYNALQQLAYFTTVFIAAPLAAVTGYRMSGMWPKNAARLNRAYPIEWARKIHFPVMVYFVGFIIVHVALVFATGALRNLNHMYAAQGSVDGVAYADNWAGFWIFTATLVVIATGWAAARPLILAPIARMFGTVTGR